MKSSQAGKRGAQFDAVTEVPLVESGHASDATSASPESPLIV